MKGQFISTRMHAMIDYMTAAMLPILPRIMGWSSRSTHLMDGVAATIATQNLITDGEMGVIKIEPMQCHLAADVFLGAGLITAAAMMDDEPDEVRLTVGGTGLVTLLMGLLTRPMPTRSAGPSQHFSQTMNRMMHRGEEKARETVGADMAG